MDRKVVETKHDKLMELLALCGAGFAGLAGIVLFGLPFILLIIICLGFLKLIFGFQIVQFWHAYFATPAAQWLKWLISRFEEDTGLAIASFALTLMMLDFLIISPNQVIVSRAVRNFQRFTIRKMSTDDWSAVHDRLRLLFGDDIEELALYERRILPANSGTEVQAAASPHRGRPSILRVLGALRILRILLKVLYVPFSGVVVFGLSLAFFDAMKRAFEENEAFFFPASATSRFSAPDLLGFAAASDWNIIGIIAATAILMVFVSNKALLTFQWPAHSLRNATIAIVVTIVALKLMLPKTLLLFSAVCIVSFGAITLLWRWIGRPVLLRVRFWLI